MAGGRGHTESSAGSTHLGSEGPLNWKGVPAEFFFGLSGVSGGERGDGGDGPFSGTEV